MKARGFREMTASESKRYDRFTECADRSDTGRSFAVRLITRLFGGRKA